MDEQRSCLVPPQIQRKMTQMFALIGSPGAKAPPSFARRRAIAKRRRGPASEPILPVHQQVLNAISHASTSLCPQGHHGLPYPKVCPYVSLLEPLPVRVEKGGPMFHCFPAWFSQSQRGCGSGRGGWETRWGGERTLASEVLPRDPRLLSSTDGHTNASRDPALLRYRPPPSPPREEPEPVKTV
ncbi:hypothetical protein J1605_015826 [Eschrichtius robustus]|uniref:Uncharacterized protein n=1 Tax=Eschrichtius robustus TaxID=9764 RepID=A0AB34GBY8_ESCRO|nr:hypothetical protein J1605_015826 [Eschrichtius robustus]